MSDTEFILCAAIYFDDGKYHEQQPKYIATGIVVCGRRHHNCFALLYSLGINKLDLGPSVQGFLTSRDRFVDRTEGAKLAFESGQIEDTSDYLISEDLY